MDFNLHIHIDNVHIHEGEGGHHHNHHSHPRRLRLMTLGPVTEQNIVGPVAAGVSNMVVVVKDTQQVDVTYGKPLDKKGKETEVEAGSVAWKSTDETVATVVQDATDPLKALIVAGNPGVCEVFPTADADLGDGVVSLEGEHLGVQVTPGEAVGFGSPVVGSPVEQP